MRISKRGLDVIKRFEGLALKPYRDAVGIPTIGYGNTYYEDGRKVSMTDAAISEARAEKLLKMVLVRYEDAVNRYAQLPLSQNQFDALVSFAYNVGNENLRKSSLMRLLNQGRFQAAADEFLRWNRAGGRVLEGLRKRRIAERALFLAD